MLGLVPGVLLCTSCTKSRRMRDKALVHLLYVRTTAVVSDATAYVPALIPGRHHGGASYVESCIGLTIRCPQTVPRHTNNCSISYLVSRTCTRRSRQKQPNHRILDTCRVRTAHKPLSTKHPSRSATWCHQLPGTVRGLMKRNKPQTHFSSRETCRDVERQFPAVRTSYLQFIATDDPMHHARKLCPLRPSNSRLHSSFTTSTSSTAAASRCV